MDTAYEVIVHGVKIKLPVINGADEPWVSQWESLDYAKGIADDFLRYGFHSIEVRDTFSDKLEYILTIKDKEELNARIS